MNHKSNSLPRRSFLRQTGFAVAASPLLGGLVIAQDGAAPTAASNKVRVGLIGCGGMGRGNLATFFKSPEVECPIICDVDDGMLAQASEMIIKERGRKPIAVKDFRRVLDKQDIDAVIVSTPDHWHALPTVLACQAGKDVYVEKPLANTIAEGRAMVTAMEKHKRVVQMGTHWRSGKHWAEAVEFIRAGKLGKVGTVRGWAYHDWLGDVGNPPDGPVPNGVDYDMWLGPAPKRPFNPNRFHFNFRWFWDYAGGLMTDWGVHLINIMLWAMGPEAPKSVFSSGGKFVLDDNSETPDTQTTVYEFPSYTLIWEHKVGVSLGLNNRPWGISFTGREGSLIITDSGWEVLSEPKRKSLEAKKYPGSGDARPAHVRNFLDCMKTREQPVEHLALGHHVSSVAHLGNIAYRVGRKVSWDATTERAVGDAEANKLVTANYRAPWELPYLKS